MVTGLEVTMNFMNLNHEETCIVAKTNSPFSNHFAILFLFLFFIS